MFALSQQLFNTTCLFAFPQLRCYDRGDVLFSLPHGDECASLFVVVQGSVKLRHLLVNENELVVSPGTSGSEIVSTLLPGIKCWNAGVLVLMEALAGADVCVLVSGASL